MNIIIRSGILLVSFTATAVAGEEALVTYKSLSPQTALELAQSSLANCRERGFQVAVAVVDRFGVVQVVLRDQFAGPHTVETARRKAWTAVSFRTDTLRMEKLTQAGQLASGVRHVSNALMIGGGVPIEAAGSIVGGIGISGGPGGEADDACARVGIEAISEKLDF